MRIAVLATNRNPLSEPFAGGQESLTAALVRGFRRRGHEVVLYASAGTPVDLADVVVTYPELPRLSEVAALDPQLPEKPFLADHHAFTFAVRDLATRAGLDVVANHSLHHLPLSLSTLLPVPVVTTLHTPPFPWLELGAVLAAPTARYVAVSQALAQQWTILDAQVISNGVDASIFEPGPGSPAGDLVWVGRITPEKAPHLAIRAARAAGRRLRLAGPVSDADYARDVVFPLLGDGVEFVGPLGPGALATLIGRSAALLVTPRWDEPFGLVAVEAALCGTPVVALGRGGVGEAVTPRTGIVIADDGTRDDDWCVAELAWATKQSKFLDRDEVRRCAVELFSLEGCVAAHLDVLHQAAGVES